MHEPECEHRFRFEQLTTAPPVPGLESYYCWLDKHCVCIVQGSDRQGWTTNHDRLGAYHATREAAAHIALNTRRHKPESPPQCA